MKKNVSGYLGLWILLIVAIVIFTIISHKGGFDLGTYHLKGSSMANVFHAGSDDLTWSEDSLNNIEESLAVNETKTDSTYQNILIFGDSMTFNLALRLAQYAKQNGHTINSINWDSSSTKIWADYDTLKYYIDKYKPTQIFIALGSNEATLKKPETRIPYIRKIIETIDTIPYVWIGPPSLAQESTINDILENVCGKRHFFLSNGLTLARRRDKIHPTKEASAEWIDSIIRWLPNSTHPFIADVPSDTIGKCNPHIRFIKALNK